MFCRIALAILLALPLAATADVKCTDEYKDWLKAQKVDANSTASQTAKRKVDACEVRRAASIANCTQNEADFKDVIKKTRDVCTAKEIKASPDTGAIECIGNTTSDSGGESDSCDCLDTKLSALDRRTMKCPPLRSSKLKHCSGASDSSADRNTKKLKDAEERVDKLRDKIRSLEDDKIKVNNDKKDKKKTQREAKAKALEAYQQAIAQAEEGASQAQKAMYEQMNGIQKEITTANQAVTDAAIKKSAAYLDLTEQQMRIELECSKRATAAVNAMVSEAIVGIKSGTFNRGDQNVLFKKVGLTERQDWQQQAAIKKRQCMEGEDTHASQKSATIAYEKAKDMIEEQKRNAETQVSELKQNMAQIQSPAGCTVAAANGMARRSQACMDADARNNKINAALATKKAADKAAKEDNPGEDNPLLAALSSDNDASRSKAEQLKEAKGELVNQQARLAALRAKEDLLEAKENEPATTASVPERTPSLDVTALDLTDKAGRINYCCDQRPNRVSESACTSAKQFMEARGFDVTLTSANPQSTSTTTGPRAPADEDPSAHH